MDAVNPNPQKIVIKSFKGFELVEPLKILYFEADKKYTIIHEDSDVKSHRVLSNISDFENSYPLFFRCHRSFIVNLFHVTSFNLKEFKLVLKDLQEVPVAANRVKSLKEKLGIIKSI